MRKEGGEEEHTVENEVKEAVLAEAEVSNEEEEEEEEGGR